jgi:hypothetical protein
MIFYQIHVIPKGIIKFAADDDDEMTRWNINLGLLFVGSISDFLVAFCIG